MHARDDEESSEESDADTNVSSSLASAASTNVTEPDLITPPQSQAGPVTMTEDQTHLNNHREDLTVILGLLQNMRGMDQSEAPQGVEDEVHRLAMDVLKECRDNRTTPPDWVVNAAMDTGSLAEG